MMASSRILGASMLVLASALAAPVAAQTVPQSGTASDPAPQKADNPASSTTDDTAASRATAPDGDVVVTARRRDERSLDVPVAISAISGATLETKNITSLAVIGQQAPSVKIETNIVGFGGLLTIRGVSSATSTSSIEQAVTTNIDGIPISFAGVVRLGQFDLGQVEILRGPQALFFGKNATGGIISLRSAEPTDRLDVLGRAGYEFEAGEYFFEGHVSGPLSDTLKARLAVRYSDMDGYLDNIVPAGTPGAFLPRHRKAPGTSETSIKGSVVFTPDSALTIKLRGAYGKVDTQGSALSQRYYCPFGVPQGPSRYAGETDCKLDNRTSSGDLNPALHNIDPRFPADGVPFTNLKQALAIAEIAYNFTDGLTLSSLTGYYHLTLNSTDQLNFGPQAIVNYADSTRKHTFSEEVRLTSSFTGPFNFMGGVFYQRDSFKEGNLFVIAGTALPRLRFLLGGHTVSPFIQASLNLFAGVTASGGVRYTHEVKTQHLDRFDTQVPHRTTFNDWSPEATLSWKPTKDVNLYGSYKEGYKSGGFQTEFTSFPVLLARGFPVNNAYGAETVKGFEAGAKANLIGRTLRVNLAAYDFKYSNLQLGRFDPVTISTFIENVGASRTKGIEGDLTYNTPLEGLSLTAAAAYNRSRYIRYQSACYNGQTAAQGCDLATRTQNLAGRPLPRAPEWSGNLNADYAGQLNADIRYHLSAGATFSGRYETLSESIPGARQKAYALYDAGIAFGPTDERWEIAFIGRDLSNRFYASGGAQVPVTGSATVPSDVFTTGNRGRELIARLTIHPFR